MRFFLEFGFLVLIVEFCGCPPAPIFSGLYAAKEENPISETLRRVKKDTGNNEYLEECAFVDSWQGQHGFINVLAFLDASWHYSHRQANMLKMLQDRLEKSGMQDIHFFVINSAEPEASFNDTDMEDEKKAWSDAESAEYQEVFSEVEQTREALKKRIDPNIAFIQDNDELKIWDKLSATRDQVLVIDRCGKLSYRVIVPWSILHFPYVKAAILSTYKEQPCGSCDMETTSQSNYNESQTEEHAELLPESFDVMRMKEIAVQKYNLDDRYNKPKKIYHAGNQPKEIPQNIIELLNRSANVRLEKAEADLRNDLKNATDFSTTIDPKYDDVDSTTLISTRENFYDDDHEYISVTTDTSNISDSTEFQNDENSLLITLDKINIAGTENTGSDNFESTTEVASQNIFQNYTDHEEEKLDAHFDPTEKSESRNAYVDENDSESETSNYFEKLNSNQGDNQIKRMTVESVENDSEEHSQNADYVMPIRIIMHAPHTHQNEEPVKKHEYLVLRIGEPEFHGHLEYDGDFLSNDNLASSETGYDKIGILDEEIMGKNNSEADQGSGEVSGDDSGKDLSKHHQRHKSGNKGSRGKHLDQVYDKDESPGFYGEDSEYWRINIGKAEQLRLGEDNEKQLNITTKIIDEKEPIIEEQVSTDLEKEDEITSQLFKHYSKLLPWLDYVFER